MVYPDYPHLQQRRHYDYINIYPWLTDCKRLKDVGCGEASIDVMLSQTTDIKKFFLYDLSEHFLDSVWWKMWQNANYKTKRLDIAHKKVYPKSDVTLMLGVSIYIPDNDMLCDLLCRLNTKRLILRDPCAYKKSIFIDKYSERLDAKYSAYYRTAGELEGIIKKAGYKIIHKATCYPKRIESEYKSRQYYYVCEVEK